MNRSLLLLLAFLVLGFLLLEFAAVPYDDEHDSGSHAAIAYYAKERMQFGVDVYENAGPLAFAHYSSTYSGLLTLPAILLKNAIRMALALLVVLALRWMPGWIPKILWASLFLVPWLPALDTTDPYSILTIYLAGLALLCPMRSPTRGAARDAALACLLGTLGLMKHTLLVLSGATILLVVSARLTRRDVRAALQLAALTALFVVLPWTLAGQHLANLPAFLRSVAAFSAGYNEALASDAPITLSWIAGAVLASAVALSFWNARRGACSIWQALLGPPFAFVLWKYGMVRGDPQHVAVLFVAALHLIPPMAWTTDVPQSDAPGVREPSSRGGAFSIGAGVMVAALSAAGAWMSPEDVAFPSVSEHLRGTVHWIRAPGNRIRELEAELDAIRERHSLPGIRARVGSTSIDQYGFRQGVLLLNRLQYRPRPTPITFAAATRDLLLRNEEYYRGPRAPAFVLVQLEALSPDDSHLLSQRDCLALGALFDGYHPSLVEGTRLLLERNPPEQQRATAAWRALIQREIRLGERLPLDWRSFKFIWATIEVEPNWAGRIRSFLLRPPSVQLRLWLVGGDSIVRRFSATAARSPFLVNPLIEDTRALLAAYEGDELRSVEGLAVEPAPGMGGFFDATVRVVILQGPEPRTSAR